MREYVVHCRSHGRVGAAQVERPYELPFIDEPAQADAYTQEQAAGLAALYSELRRERYNAWKDIIFNFDARKACLG